MGKPFRYVNARRLSREHFMRLKSWNARQPSLAVSSELLGVSRETLESALTIGATFRNATVARLEASIDRCTQASVAA